MCVCFIGKVLTLIHFLTKSLHLPNEQWESPTKNLQVEEEYRKEEFFQTLISIAHPCFINQQLPHLSLTVKYPAQVKQLQ